MRAYAALGILLVSITAAEAKVDQFAGDRYSGHSSGDLRSNAPWWSKRSVSPGSQARRHRSHRTNPLIYRHRPQGVARTGRVASPIREVQGTHRRNIRRHLARSFIADAAGALVEPLRQMSQTILGGRPSGCPARFCGCALSIKVFGHSVRNLWLAANWLNFPRAAARPGMVAARRGHVFQLIAHIRGSVWRVYDPNSGHNRIREHARSIAGYAIVNPAARLASLQN